MEDMLATLPRVVSVSAVAAGCLPTQDTASGAQSSGGASSGGQEDQRCNGTLRRQASPRPGVQGPGLALAPGLQGRVKRVQEKRIGAGDGLLLFFYVFLP